MKIIAICFLVIMPILSGVLQARIQGASAHTTLQEEFLVAENAIRKGDLQTFELLKPNLELYALYPYLEYEVVLRQLREPASPVKQGILFKELKSFHDKYPDSPLFNHLLYHWLVLEARHHRFENFLIGYKLRLDDFAETSIHCLYNYALFQTTQNKLHLQSAIKYWLVGKPQPPSCNRLFDLMREEQILTSALILERIRLGIESKQWDFAKQLVAYLPKEQQPYGDLWLAIAQNPQIIHDAKMLQLVQLAPFQDKIILTAFKHFTQENYQASRSLFALLKEKLSLSDDTCAKIKQEIAIKLAQNKEPEALDWLKDIPPSLRNQVAKEWLIRLSLYHKDWSSVIRYIDELEPLHRTEKKWRYWRARAYLALGKSPAAISILKRLSLTRSYYGFLASEILQKPYAYHNNPQDLNPIKIRLLDKDPTIQRIKELIHFGREHAVKKEWLFFLKSLNEEDKIHAAAFAQAQHWHDLTLLAMNQVDFKDNLALRFPFAYDKEIYKYSALHALDPAWVFAVTRQESAFQYQARSPMGAIGLMQLMPNTARQVANVNKISLQTMHDFMEPDNNILLGTSYLKSLNNSLSGKVVLATASYNAGIGRIQRWLPEKPLDSDIWIENIPFVETRNYVQNVLTSMGIYKTLMHQPFRLSWVMEPVGKSNL